MATKKEFATLYLAMKGINTSGNTVDKMVKETAQEELAQNLITTLRKLKHNQNSQKRLDFYQTMRLKQLNHCRRIIMQMNTIK